MPVSGVMFSSSVRQVNRHFSGNVGASPSSAFMRTTHWRSHNPLEIPHQPVRPGNPNCRSRKRLHESPASSLLRFPRRGPQARMPWPSTELRNYRVTHQRDTMFLRICMLRIQPLFAGSPTTCSTASNHFPTRRKANRYRRSIAAFVDVFGNEPMRRTCRVCPCARARPASRWQPTPHPHALAVERRAGASIETSA